MHRNINLNKENKYYIELYRNRREVLAEIPKEFISSIKYDTSTYATMSIEIPNKIVRNGQIVNLNLYDQIKGKMFLVIDINGQKERYIIDEDYKISETKDIKTKQLTAYSYEKTIEKKTLLISDGATRQLYRPDGETVEVSDGILNWFEEQTGWKVKHVDELARKEMGIYYETVDVKLFENHIVDPVKKGGVIWEKDIVTNVENKALTMTISYPTMKTYDGNGNLLKTETIYHTFENLPYNVKHIKATYTSDTDFLFGITYELTMFYKETLADGSEIEHTVIQEKKYNFTNLSDLKLEAPEINLNYETNTLREHLTTKYRFFEQCSTKWYNFLMADVSKAFDCVFVFDSYNMEVSVYDKKTFGTYNGLYLGWEHIKEINKTHKIGEVVSRLYVESPNTSIAGENPLGTEYVECYDYYINSGIMSDVLKQALEKYNKLLEEKQIEFLLIKNEKNEVDQLLTKKNSELLSLQERYKAENAILTAYVKANDAANQATQSEVVAKLDKEIQDMLNTIQGIKDKSNELLEKMSNIGLEIRKENAILDGNKIFTQEDLLELEDYTIEGATTNDYYTLSTSLYNHALEVIKDMNTIYIDFSISVADFIKKIAHPDGWQKFIRLGEKIEIDDKDIADVDGFVQLHGYTLSPKTDAVSNLNFTNNKEPISDIKTISDIGRTASSTSHMTDFYKAVWKDSAQNNVNVKDIIENGLDVAAQVVRGKGTTNRIDISESGIYVIDANDENKQLYLGASIIAFTVDRWKTSKLAIDTNGVIADSLIGKVILGDTLYIGNEDNTVVIRPNGMSVYDPKATQDERIFLGIDKTTNEAVLRLHSSDGSNRLVLSEQGIYQVFPYQARDSFDKYLSFKLTFYLPNSLQRLDEARLYLNLEKFRAYSKAMSTQPSETQGFATAGGGYFEVRKSSEGGGYHEIRKSSESGGYHEVRKSSESGGYRNVQEITAQGGAQVPPTYAPQPVGGNVHLETHVHQLDIRHTHSFNFEIPAHTHQMNINIPNHTHQMNINIPNHTHQMNIDIPNHTHDVDVTIPSHSHDIVYGIYEYQQMPTVRVLLDGVIIADDLSITSNFNLLDKFTYLGGTHTLEVVSKETNANPEGLGRASLDLFVSGFVSY